MVQKTPLYECHLQLSAKIVDFAGWDMPLHYGSQIQEHHAVRQDAGMFDVSHMGILDLTGPGVATFLKFLLANNVGRLANGKALYTCMLNEQGGVIDDLIVYKIADDFYRLVVNAGTRAKDLIWIKKNAQAFAVNIVERFDTAMIAVQGPHAREKVGNLFTQDQHALLNNLKPFTSVEINRLFIARTGYTGEEGYEIILLQDEAAEFWQKLLRVGIKPCGLGARDTLRLEAGFNLYGSDMDEDVSPLESNLAWTVIFDADRDFIGKNALELQRTQGLSRKLVGIVLEGPGVLRNHQKIKIENLGEGEITSGSFSPTLNKGIALARVPIQTQNSCLVDMRGKWVPARIIQLPFVCQGKKTFTEINQSMERYS